MLPGFWSFRKLHILRSCPSSHQVCRLAMWKFCIQTLLVLLVCAICTWWMCTPPLASLVSLWLSSRIFGSPAATISWIFSCKTVLAFLVPSWCLCQGGHWFFLHLAVTGNIDSNWNSLKFNKLQTKPPSSQPTNSWLKCICSGCTLIPLASAKHRKIGTSKGTEMISWWKSMSSKDSCPLYRYSCKHSHSNVGWSSLNHLWVAGLGGWEAKQVIDIGNFQSLL